MKILKGIGVIVIGVVVFILLIDFGCFCLWIFSGQIPIDNFYFGTITAHIIGLFL